jgi:beta-xylosidase
MDLSALRTGKSVASSDKSFLSNVLSGVNHCLHRTGLEDRKIHVTLWNSSILTRNVLHDGPYKSAYIMSTMIECWNKCSMLGYWNATDLTSLDADTEIPLFGGSGLISQNNIKKPSFYAFSFLNSLLPYHLTSSNHAIVTTDDKGRFSICCHNYKHFNYLYYSQKEEKIKIEEQSSLFEDMEPVSLKIDINDLPKGNFLIKRRFVSENAGNVQNAWLHLNKLSELSQGELSYLKSQAEPGLFYETKRSDNGTIVLEETLSPQEIRLIEIEKIDD